MKSFCVCLVAIVLACVAPAQQPTQGTASIAGRITDASGNPYPSQVQVYQIIIRDGIGNVYPKCHTFTRKEGGFECPQLPAGRYIVQVLPLLPPSVSGTRASTSIAVSVFYSNVTDLDLANIISLKGGEQKWTDFQLFDTSAVEISGVLLNHTAQAAFTLKAESGGRSVDTGVHVRYDDKTGQFRAERVPPGHYLLTADWFINGAEQRAALPLTVADTPVHDLRLSAGSNAAIGGTLSGLPAGSNISDIRLECADGSNGDINAPVKNGAYHFHPVPAGDYILTLSPNQSLYVDSLTVGDQNVAGPRVRLGQDETEIHVDIALQGPALTIRGTVAPWDSAAPRAQVVAQNEQSGQVYATITGPDRRFSLMGLSPGAYRLYAWPGIDTVEYRNPSVLKRYKNQSTELSLDADSLTSSIELSPMDRID